MPLPVDVGDHGEVVNGHQDCGAQRKGEAQEGFEHCFHFQQTDVEALFL